MGCSAIVGLYLGSEVLNGLRLVFHNPLEQRVLFDMRRDLHQKLLILPISFYDQRKSGEISSRVIEDVMAVERALLDGTEIGGRALVMIIGVTIVLFTINPLLAFFVFIPVPSLIIIGIYYSKGSRKVWKRVRESAGDLNSLLVEDIQGNRLIQTFALQKREGQRFDEKAELLRFRTLRAMFRWAAYSPGTSFVTNLGTVAVIGIGCWMILQGDSGFGFPDMVAFRCMWPCCTRPLGSCTGSTTLWPPERPPGNGFSRSLMPRWKWNHPQIPSPSRQTPCMYSSTTWPSSIRNGQRC